MTLAAPLRTDRLLLRTLDAGDATARYLGWLSDTEVNRYLESRLSTHTLDSLRAFIAQCNASADELLLGICLADGRHVGNIKLGPVNAFHRHAAVGLLIGERDCWGRGYASEAIGRVAAHAFDALEVEKLYAGCYASNVASLRAFLKAGFVEESRQKSFWRSGEIREDNIQVGLTRADWQARR
jgi:ribosomal-protein-alanine N-acetyltransferase